MKYSELDETAARLVDSGAARLLAEKTLAE